MKLLAQSSCTKNASMFRKPVWELEDSSILSSIISPRSQQQPRNSYVHYWFHFRLFLFSVRSCLVALQALACPEKNLPGLPPARFPPFYKSWLRSCPTSPIHYQWRHDLLRSRYDCKLYVGNCRHAPTVVSLGSPWLCLKSEVVWMTMEWTLLEYGLVNHHQFVFVSCRGVTRGC